MSDRAKAYLVGVLAAVVLITAGFLVWKTMFASKTYTDDQYGYSFSYPGRWEFLDESDMFSFTDLANFGADGMIVDLAAAGHGDSLENTAMVGVCVFDVGSLYLDASRLQVDLETNLALAASQGYPIAVVEPVQAEVFGGVPGCRFAISATSMGVSVTITYGALIDGDLLYVLMGVAPESNWSDSQKTFENFFKSFKPGATRA
jgi:hypothetical protein